MEATISLITHCIREINETQASRSNWENNPEIVRIVQRFKDRFSVLYNALKSDFNKEVRMSDLEKPGDDDIIEKLLNDFKSKNLSIEKQDIIKKLEECEGIAIENFNKNNS